MAAVMSAEMNHTDTVVVMLDECRRMGLKVLAPDINASAFRFTVNESGQILYGLGAIKGVGEGALEGILGERARGGRFADLFDFCRRIDTRRANKRVLEALVCAGALDGLGLNRPSLLATLPTALQLAEQTAAGASAGQEDLFGLGAPQAVAAKIEADVQPEWPDHERLAREKEVLGLYLSGHPIEAYRPLIDQVCSGTIKQLIAEAAAPAFGSGASGDDEDSVPLRRRPIRRTVMLAAWLAEVRNVGGERPGKLLQLDDRSGQLVCWLDFDAWQRYQNVLRRDTLVFATGELRAAQREGRDLEYRLYARGFWDLDGIMKERAERVTLVWRGQLAKAGALDARLLRTKLATFKGEPGAQVTMEYWNGRARATLDFGPEWRLQMQAARLTELRRLLGDDAVRVDYRRFVAPAGGRTEYGYAE
jgi:DNA polymerase-3 subunit alpha